ncbi:MAG: hypothetical protein M1813_004696 [Trichoglossum hirsutum]|nr:MAG: hypothetical protein M1813_004696 [Trichoglossum hirsutum]
MGKSWAFPLWTLSLISLSLCAVAAAAALVIDGHHHHGSHRPTRRDTCSGFKGQSDLYGLGIRLGVYLQWISSQAANCLLPDEMPNALDTNSIFLFAVFIALAKATLNHKLHAAEVFVMLQICFGYLFSVLSLSGLRVTILSNPDALAPELWAERFTEYMQNYAAYQQDVQERSVALVNALKHTPHNLAIGVRVEIWILQMWNIMALYAILGSPSSISYEYWILGGMLWPIDILVSLRLALHSRLYSNEQNPIADYRLDMLKSYQEIRNLRKKILITLRLKSSFKHPQVSWLGVCWRLSLVACITAYNIWFWVAGLSLLTSNSCSTSIFLFTNLSIFGAAKRVYKIISIFLIIWGGSLGLTCLVVITLFFFALRDSIYVNTFVIPYIRLCYLAFSGTRDLQKDLQIALERFSAPSLRQLLKTFAQLSSHSNYELGQEKDQKEIKMVAW